MKLNYSYCLIAAMALAGATACSGRNKAAVAEAAAQATHSAAQCPKIAEGYYNADNDKSKFIEVYDNKDAQQLEINLNGVEQIPINGKDTPQKNGFRLTGICTANTIKIVGKDKQGNLSDTTIKPAADGGLQVEQNSPKIAPVHYSAAGGLRTPMDVIKRWFTNSSQGTGLPQQGDQPSFPQPST